MRASERVCVCKRETEKESESRAQCARQGGSFDWWYPDKF